MSYEGNEEFWFRFMSLSELQVHALRGHGVQVEARPKRNAPGQFVASFRLSSDSTYDWLPSFVQSCKLAVSEYGIFISILTKHDSEIVTLPAFVLAVHHSVAGQIEFSFTVISDSSE
jgi:hypothetical protein